MEYTKAAHSLNIPAIGALLSWDNLTSKGTYNVIPDYLFVWNQNLVEEAVQIHDFEPQQVFVSGAAVYDPWFDLSPSTDRALFCAQVGLDPAKPNAEPVLRRYLESALLTALALNNLFEGHTYDVVCFNHGIYVPQGIIVEACRAKNIPVVTWNPSYRKTTFIFSHGDSYHHTMISEPTDVWENIEMTPALVDKTMDYLKSRWRFHCIRS